MITVFWALSVATYTVLSAEGGVPAEALHFVPGEFGLQLSMSQGNDPEALLGVRL